MQFINPMHNFVQRITGFTRAPTQGWSARLLLLLLLAGCGTGESSSPVKKPKPSAKPRPVQKPVETKPVVVHQSKPVTKSPIKSEPEPVAKPYQPPTIPRPKPVFYRPSDTRPKHNDAYLAGIGIKRYASKHLILYTDIKPQKAAGLPKLVDQLYADLEAYFGPLPPDREGSVFQMTGYIMAEPRLFRESDLLPDDLPGFNHGRHRGAEFWLNDQEFDYYRRHLMLHEATHCFMTITRLHPSVPPVWYMEGMAEFFGTHSLKPDGTAKFRLMPDNKEAFGGLGRILLVKTEVEEGRFLTLDQVFQLSPNDFSKNESYAWSWAMCQFLAAHPKYGKRFQELGNAPTKLNFLRGFDRAFKAEQDNMRTEWALFAHALDHGYQNAPAAIDFQPGQAMTAGASKTLEVQANRGWQSTAVLVEQGKKYTLSASGQFTLAQTPKPWVSEADGISFRYFDNRPLGQLLGCIRTQSSTSIATALTMRRVFACGANHTFIAPQTGTLYLRLNDRWDQLSDNTGITTVQLRQN